MYCGTKLKDYMDVCPTCGKVYKGQNDDGFSYSKKKKVSNDKPSKEEIKEIMKTEVKEEILSNIDDILPALVTLFILFIAFIVLVFSLALKFKKDTLENYDPTPIEESIDLEYEDLES